MSVTRPSPTSTTTKPSLGTLEALGGLVSSSTSPQTRSLLYHGPIHRRRVPDPSAGVIPRSGTRASAFAHRPAPIARALPPRPRHSDISSYGPGGSAGALVQASASRQRDRARSRGSGVRSCLCGKRPAAASHERYPGGSARLPPSRRCARAGPRQPRPPPARSSTAPSASPISSRLRVGSAGRSPLHRRVLAAARCSPPSSTTATRPWAGCSSAFSRSGRRPG